MLVQKPSPGPLGTGALKTDAKCRTEVIANLEVTQCRDMFIVLLWRRLMESSIGVPPQRITSSKMMCLKHRYRKISSELDESVLFIQTFRQQTRLLTETPRLLFVQTWSHRGFYLRIYSVDIPCVELMLCFSAEFYPKETLDAWTHGPEHCDLREVE